MPIRWIKQRDLYSCGPVALINLLKWYGRPATYGWLRDMQRVCVCVKPKGTNRRNFSRAIKSFGIRCIKRARPTIKFVDNWLRAGGVIILSYTHDRLWHYSLLVGKDGEDYVVINHVVDVTIVGDTRDDMKEQLAARCNGHGSSAWFFKR